MKTSLITPFAFLLFIVSCSKTGVIPAKQTIQSATQNDALQNRNLTAILTAHQWIYQEFYSHYIDDQHKGQRFYDRDSTGNLDEYLGGVVFSFHKNHTFNKYVNPYNYRGTWQFSDNKPTYLTLKFNYGNVEKDSVLVFNADHLNYLRKDNYSQWFTELIPAQ